ncbi:MAG: tetratricopeptide repeat protein [Acidobacteriota bacterium]|nr:tetratricopeptide repeat protein [Acidobacteriota bacterium]
MVKIRVFVGLALFAVSVPALQAQPVGQPAFNSRPVSSQNVYYEQGVKHSLAGRAEQAVSAFLMALRLDPENGDTYFNLGNAYSQLKRWAHAAEAYKQAVRFNRKDGEAYKNLGRAYFNAGLYAQAIDPLKNATRIYPVWAEPHYLLSDAYFKVGKVQDAEKLYQQAVNLAPNDPARPHALVATRRTTERPVPGNAAARPVNKPTATNATPVNKPAATNESRARTSTGNEKTSVVEDARQQTEKAKNNDAKDYYNLGLKQGRAKRYGEAVEAFQQAIKIRPDYTDAYFGLGHAYADMGRWQEAVEAYEQVLRFDPKDNEATYRLGEAYAKVRAQTKANGANGDGRPIGERVGAPVASNAVNATTSAAVPPSPAPSLKNSETAEATETTDDAHLTKLYRVGPGDVLDVRLLSASANQSTLYTVTAGGLLEYPLAGDPLDVAGSTPEEISARLAAELQRRAVDEKPEVIVGVREYTSHNVIISGLVRDPGTKVLRREAVPLYVVVADAQPTDEAEEVRIVSVATGRKTAVSLSDAEAMNMLVRPGDVISVGRRPEQFFYIGGKVEAPGQKRFHAELTLTQAILSSGGELSRGGTVKLLRQDGQGFLTTTEYKIKSLTSGKIPDPPLQPNDRVEVIQ